MLTLMCNLFSCTPSLHSLSLQDFEQKLQQVEPALLIDVRTPQEYDAGHLKNALNIDVKADNFCDEIEKLDKGCPIFVYCRSGGRSKTAANIFKKAGFKTVYELDKGIIGWIESGKPVEN